jgi:hypothetical protein
MDDFATTRALAHESRVYSSPEIPVMVNMPDYWEWVYGRR